jgi:hypothetical protein
MTHGGEWAVVRARPDYAAMLEAESVPPWLGGR